MKIKEKLETDGLESTCPSKILLEEVALLSARMTAS